MYGNQILVFWHVQMDGEGILHTLKFKWGGCE